MQSRLDNAGQIAWVGRADLDRLRIVPGDKRILELGVHRGWCQASQADFDHRLDRKSHNQNRSDQQQPGNRPAHQEQVHESVAVGATFGGGCGERDGGKNEEGPDYPIHDKILMLESVGD